MDLVQLRMFCSVAETGSLARAAEQLHRVPSNLTTRLRQLEEELGVDLFIRENNHIRLSARPDLRISPALPQSGAVADYRHLGRNHRSGA